MVVSLVLVTRCWFWSLWWALRYSLVTGVQQTMCGTGK